MRHLWVRDTLHCILYINNRITFLSPHLSSSAPYYNCSPHSGWVLEVVRVGSSHFPIYQQKNDLPLSRPVVLSLLFVKSCFVWRMARVGSVTSLYYNNRITSLSYVFCIIVVDQIQFCSGGGTCEFVIPPYICEHQNDFSASLPRARHCGCSPNSVPFWIWRAWVRVTSLYIRNRKTSLSLPSRARYCGH